MDRAHNRPAPIQMHLLTMPTWRLRILLAFAIAVLLSSMPLPMAGAFMWSAVWSLLAFNKALGVALGEQRHVCQRLEADRDGYVALLAERDAQIAALEADLKRARTVSSPAEETEEERLYRQVGLHPRALSFLLIAARRAFRAALHPDRHLRHAQEAHQRFLRAEGVFDRIAMMRV